MAKRGRKPKYNSAGTYLQNMDNIEYIDFDDPTEYGGRDVDYSTLLWRQIDRILKAGTYGIDEVYITGVLELYRMLEPYWDVRFIDWYTVTKQKYMNLVDEVEPNKQGGMMKNVERQFAHVLFGKLMALMTNRGLLPMKALKPF